MKDFMVKLGFHVSISGGIDKAVDRALDLGCDTFQIFSRNPRSWASRALREEESEAFREKRRQAGIEPVFDHMPYILNLASPVDEVYLRSLESLSVELGRCSALGVPMVVTHIGSHMGAGSDRGISRVVEGVRGVLDGDGTGVMVLLENGPGSRNSVGSGFEELGLILEGIDHPDRAAVCLDTCHAFVAGHDLRTEEGLEMTIETFDDSVGLERLMLVHLNDSVGGLGTGVDHHEHIGLGEIGLDGFKRVMGSRLSEAPMVMETPEDELRTDAENMRIARELASARM